MTKDLENKVSKIKEFFNQLEFEESTHTYKVLGEQLSSASSTISNFYDSFDLLDISRTGMTATDTDLMLIDIANSLTTSLRRTIKIKARTTASDSAVTTLQSKTVVIQVV